MIWEPEPLTPIGYINRSHGYKGALRIERQNTQLDLTKEESVFVEIDNKPVPFFISEILQTTDRFYIIHFKEIPNQKSAENIIGNTVLVTSDSDTTTPSSPLKLVGYRVLYPEGELIGTVKGIVEKPGQQLIYIETENGSFYAPLATELITKIVDEKHQLFFDLPEGLDDL